MDILRAVLKRKAQLSSHTEMKHSIVGTAIQTLSQSEINRFAEILFDDLNPEVVNRLEIFASKGMQILLATAAADFFLPAFTGLLKNFTIDFIGTPYKSVVTEFVENKGDVKLSCVKNYLKSHNLQLQAFITDHIDDLPLLRYNLGENILVNPSKPTVSLAKKAGIKFETI